MIYRFFAPLLSAQLMTAPTGRPKVTRNLLPAAAFEWFQKKMNWGGKKKYLKLGFAFGGSNN